MFSRKTIHIIYNSGIRKVKIITSNVLFGNFGIMGIVGGSKTTKTGLASCTLALATKSCDLSCKYACCDMFNSFSNLSCVDFAF